MLNQIYNILIRIRCYISHQFVSGPSFLFLQITIFSNWGVTSNPTNKKVWPYVQKKIMHFSCQPEVGVFSTDNLIDNNYVIWEQFISQIAFRSMTDFHDCVFIYAVSIVRYTFYDVCCAHFSTVTFNPVKIDFTPVIDSMC